MIFRALPVLVPALVPALLVTALLVTALLVTRAGASPATAADGVVVVDLKNLPDPPPAPPPPQISDATKKVFSERCAQCHGPTGHGDGPLAAAMSQKPRNFTDRSWQQTTSDDAIAKIIETGGALLGKSPLMPANPDLAANKAMLKELIVLVRSFSEPRPPSVRITLERVDDANAAKAPVVIGEKRLRLRGGNLRARFEGMPRCKARVRGFVDLDGDGRQTEGVEPSLDGAPVDVGNGEAVTEVATPPLGSSSKP
jgi:mono/diheme cytochrome c family protein